MKFVEMFGLPGCGKTTISRALVNRLCLTQNMVIVTRKDISSAIDMMYKHAILVPIFYLYHYLFFPYAGFKRHLHAFADQFHFSKLRMIYEVYCIIMYHKYKKHILVPGYFVLDEGFVQFLSSIAHGEEVKKNSLLYTLCNDILNISKDTMYIDCRLESSIVVQRIIVRGKQDRFRYSSELQDKLALKQRNLKTISEALSPQNQLILDMEKTPERNTETIIDLL